MSLTSFIRQQREQRERLGSAEQAIAFALAIDDHFDLRQFLDDWQTGAVATNDEYSDYWNWLRWQRRAR
jgi:hypothetical protein